jgi:hypothetical protein
MLISLPFSFVDTMKTVHAEYIVLNKYLKASLSSILELDNHQIVSLAPFVFGFKKEPKFSSFRFLASKKSQNLALFVFWLQKRAKITHCSNKKHLISE